MNKLIISLIVVVVAIAWLGTASACEDHFFFRIGAGKQGDWLTKKSSSDWIGSSAIACEGSLGYRHPIKQWMWIDITGQHKSHCDRGWPVNDDPEDELDSITLGLEFRIY